MPLLDGQHPPCSSRARAASARRRSPARPPSRSPERGRRVLIVSTDPASNLDEVLATRSVRRRRRSPAWPALRAEHRSRSGGACLPGARGRPLSRRAARRRARAAWRSSSPAPAPSRSPPSTSSRDCWATRSDRGVRPRHLRHRADGAHPAPAEPAQGLDRLHRREHDRHVLPRPARRLTHNARLYEPSRRSATGARRPRARQPSRALRPRRSRAHPRPSWRHSASPTCSWSSTACSPRATATTRSRWRSKRSRTRSSQLPEGLARAATHRGPAAPFAPLGTEALPPSFIPAIRQARRRPRNDRQLAPRAARSHCLN